MNAVANLVLKDAKIVSFGSSFVKTGEQITSHFRNDIPDYSNLPDNVASPAARVRAASAIRTAERAFQGAYSGHPTKLEYFAQADGSVALVHVVQVQNSDAGTWFEVYIDAHSGEVVSSTDFVAESGVCSWVFLQVPRAF